MIEECSQQSTNYAHNKEKRQLPHFVPSVLKLSEIEKSAVTQLACVAPIYGYNHVKGKIAGHRTKEYSPGKRLVPERCSLLQAEENTTDRSPERCGYARCSPSGNKISLFMIFSEKRKCFCVDFEWGWFPLRDSGLDRNFDNLTKIYQINYKKFGLSVCFLSVCLSVCLFVCIQ